MNILDILQWEVAKWSQLPWCSTFYKESLQLEKTVVADLQTSLVWQKVEG